MVDYFSGLPSLVSTCRGHVSLVEKYSSEVVAVGEHLGLLRQVRSPRVYHVDAGQAVFPSDFLRGRAEHTGHDKQ